MQMGAGAAPRTSSPANHLPGLHIVARLHKALGEVRVTGLPASAVVDQNGFAIASLHAGEHNTSTSGGFNVCTVRGSEVDAVVEPRAAADRIHSPSKTAVHRGRQC